MAVDFLPVGWDNGRVTPPTGINCANTATLMTELAKVMPGGANAGQSADLILTGTSYGSFGIRGYNPTGSNKLRLYGRLDGLTVVDYNVGGGNGDNLSATFRIDGSSNVEVYNIDFNGRSTGSGVGAEWGVILGAAYGNAVEANNDPNRADVFDIHIQGCRSQNSQQSGIKMDGNGGSDGMTVKLCTANDTGKKGNFGEGIYCGDGSTGRPYSNALITQCEVFNTFKGEGIEAKRNGSGTVEISYNYVHDINMDSGGAIKTERPYVVRGNRIHSVTAAGSTTDGDGIEVVGGIVENNIVWDCTGACVSALKSQNSGDTATIRHNTFDATGGDEVFKLNWETYLGPNDVLIDTDHNIHLGTYSKGSLGGGNQNDIAVSSGNFVGTISSGTANAGDGPGSAYELTGGPAVNAVSTLIVSEDAQGATRTSPTDAGALDTDALPPFDPPFALTSPTGGQAGVAVSASISGTCSTGDSVDVRLENVGTAAVIVDWSAATVTDQTFVFDPPGDMPAATELRARFRRVS